MNNLFELLELEEPISGEDLSSKDDSPEDLPAAGAQKKHKRPKKASKSKKAAKTKEEPPVDQDPASVEYEMETDESDLYFLIYCFFEDFNQVREYLQERWCDYLDGIISLGAVAVVTNTAFDMFQRAEKEMMSQIPRRSGLTDYESLSNLLFLEAGLAHVNYQAMDNVKGEELDNLMFEEADWIGLPVFWTLVDCLQHIGPTAIPLIPPAKPLKGPGPHNSNAMMRWGKDVIMELVGEACVLRGLKRRQGMAIPAEDELTRGLIELLMHRGKVPIWLVLACQVYLDIRFILESAISRGHDELVAKGASMNSIIGQYINFSKDVTDRPPPLLKHALDEVECWITDDCWSHARSDCRTAIGVDIKGLEPYFYLRRNPLLCGLMVFRSDLTMNEHGLAVANAWGATFACVHLYNAIKHELPDFPSWKDMDAVVAMNGSEYTYFGRAPTNPTDYLKRWELAAGCAPSKFARTNGASTDQKLYLHKGGPRGLLQTPKVSQVFHERYCFSADEPVLTLSNVEALLNESAQNQNDPQINDLQRLIGALSPSSCVSTTVAMRQKADASDLLLSRNYPFLQRQFQKTHALTPLQVLDTLGSSIEHESVFLKYNYFSMHERCTRLLRALYAEFEAECPEPIVERDAELPLLVRYIFMFMVAEEQGAAWKNRKDERVVERVGRIVRKVVEEEGDMEIAAVRESMVRPGGGNGLLK
jgi:hypothetical protein